MRGIGGLFRLMSYCVAAVLAASLVLALLLAGASFAFGAEHERTPESQISTPVVRLSGVISDSRCGAKHVAEPGRGPGECARLCVRRGARYVLVNGDLIYLLHGDRVTFDAYAGQRAAVNGTLDGDTLKVTSIQPQ